MLVSAAKNSSGATTGSGSSTRRAATTATTTTATASGAAAAAAAAASANSNGIGNGTTLNDVDVGSESLEEALRWIVDTSRRGGRAEMLRERAAGS